MILRLLHGDCVDVLLGFKEGEIGAVICDPPYGLEFMGEKWDDLSGKDLRGSASRLETSETASSRAGRGMKHGIHAGKPAFDLSRDAQVAMQEWHERWLKVVFRALVPGGILKAFSGTRTRHRLAAAMEATGFVLERQEAWAYGLGFPKSLDVSKALDKHFGVEREVIGQYQIPLDSDCGRAGKSYLGPVGGYTPGATRQWQGAGVITKPATPEAERFHGYGTALKPAWEPVLVGRKP